MMRCKHFVDVSNKGGKQLNLLKPLLGGRGSSSKKWLSRNNNIGNDGMVSFANAIATALSSAW